MMYTVIWIMLYVMVRLKIKTILIRNMLTLLTGFFVPLRNLEKALN